MVTSVHFKNVFKALSENCRVSKYLIFIADNVLMVEDGSGSTVVVPRLTAPPKKAAAATSGDSDDSSDCAVSASPLRSVTARTAGGGLKISVNKIPLEIAAVFFNEAVSFVPCFRCGKKTFTLCLLSRLVAIGRTK